MNKISLICCGGACANLPRIWYARNLFKTPQINVHFVAVRQWRVDVERRRRFSSFALALFRMNPQELPPHSDNVEEELRRVQLALSAVFSPAPPPGWSRELANTYLVQFQSLAVAWMVCDLLLTSQDLNHVFFAAQTLHTKCRTDVTQLPPESLPSLRESLLTQLSKETASPVVKTRLAMAIAALAVQMSWTTIVTDLIWTRNMALGPTCLASLAGRMCFGSTVPKR